MQLPSRSTATVRIDRPGNDPRQGGSETDTDAVVGTLAGALLSGGLGLAAVAKGAAAYGVGSITATGTVAVLGGGMALAGGVALGLMALTALAVPAVRQELSTIAATVGWASSPLGLQYAVISGVAGASPETIIRAAKLGSAVQSGVSLGRTLSRGIRTPTDAASSAKSAKSVGDYVRDHIGGGDFRSDPDDTDTESESDASGGAHFVERISLREILGSDGGEGGLGWDNGDWRSGDDDADWGDWGSEGDSGSDADGGEGDGGSDDGGWGWGD